MTDAFCPVIYRRGRRCVGGSLTALCKEVFRIKIKYLTWSNFNRCAIHLAQHPRGPIVSTKFVQVIARPSRDAYEKCFKVNLI
jgi:hypothetical protein